MDEIRQKLIKRQRGVGSSVSKLRIPCISFDNLQNYSSSSSRMPVPSAIQTDLTQSESQRLGEASRHWVKGHADSMKEPRVVINKDSFLFRSRLNQKDPSQQIDRKRVWSAYRSDQEVSIHRVDGAAPLRNSEAPKWMNVQLPSERVNSPVASISVEGCPRIAEASFDTARLLGELAEEQTQVFDSQGLRFDKCDHLERHADWLVKRRDRCLAETRAIEVIAVELRGKIEKERRRRARLLDRREELLAKNHEYLDILTIGPRRQADLERLVRKQQSLACPEPTLGIRDAQDAQDTERLQMIAAYSAARQDPDLAELHLRARALLEARHA